MEDRGRRGDFYPPSLLYLLSLMRKGVFMRFAKFVGVLALLIAGCAHQPPPKTASKDGIDRWNAARAGVLYSLAKEQFEGGNLDDSRKSLTNATKYAPDNAVIR